MTKVISLLKHTHIVPDGSMKNVQPLTPQPLSKPVSVNRLTHNIPCGDILEADIEQKPWYSKFGEVVDNLAENPLIN
jgi:hypothetical protein